MLLKWFKIIFVLAVLAIEQLHPSPLVKDVNAQSNHAPSNLSLKYVERTTAIVSSLIFSATGDVPYSSSDDAVFQEQITGQNKYSPAEFFVHVGDIKSGGASCDLSVYTKVATYLRASQIPVFIIPGDNEWIDCANPDQAWGYWVSTFMNFDRGFCGNPNAEHQMIRQENFAFVKKGVLIIGINMPGGSGGSPAWNQRLQDNADWVTQQFQSQGSKVRAAVIFGHELNSSRDAVFFNQFGPVAQNFGKPILYIHGSGHSWKQDFPLPQKNVMRVQVDKGGSALPVHVTVTTNNPATFEFNRAPWNSNSLPVNRLPCNEGNRIFP